MVHSRTMLSTRSVLTGQRCLPLLARYYSEHVAPHGPHVRPTTVHANIPFEDPLRENTRLRQNLALSYRLLERFNLHEGDENHLSEMAPARDGNGQVPIKHILQISLNLIKN